MTIPRSAVPALLLALAACVDHSQTYDARGGTGSRPASQPSSRPSSKPAVPLGGHGGRAKDEVAGATGTLPDVAAFDALLGRVVEGRYVDYDLVAKEREVIDRLLAGVAKADLTGADKATKLAFYINAYNAKTLEMVLKYVRGRGPDGGDLYGVLKVEEALGVEFFGAKEVIVSGKLVSLNELETLGRELGDPRIHFAVNCASISCPPLMNRAWKKATLDADLDTATEQYLRTDLGLQVKGRRVHLSKIFEWYQKDWGSEGAVKNFLMRYAPDPAKEYLDRELGYLEYDWGLNAVR